MTQVLSQRPRGAMIKALALGMLGMTAAYTLAHYLALQ